MLRRMIQKIDRQIEAARRDTTTISGWQDSPAFLSVAGAMLFWASFPPLGWSWCAWLAPVPWLRLVYSPAPLVRWFYGKLWLGGVLFWLATLQGIRLAHPANYLGWLALSLYAAAYVPVFVAGVRHAVRQTKVPLVVAAPIIWTGLEFLRGRLFTGFAVALLGHTQAEHTWVIQIADLAGAYGVSFVVMLCAAGVAEWLSESCRRKRKRALVAAMTILATTCGYGLWRMKFSPVSSEKPLQVALLQGTRDKVFEFNPELEERSFEQYTRLLQRARDAHPNLDLIIWPESAFTELLPDIIVQGSAAPPEDLSMSATEFRDRLKYAQELFASKVRSRAEAANRASRDGQQPTGSTQLLVGVESSEFGADGIQQRNTAMLIDSSGRIAGRYFKMHPVMFGEYIPFGRRWPWLYKLTPMRQGLSPGEHAVSFSVNGYRLSPSVCFESTVPHLIRGHVRELAKEGQSPDVLVNVTDDGWFWGSSILDLQLACGIFRAVELRRPFLVAANTGITVAIDGNGHIVKQIPRRQEGFVLAAVSRDGRHSLYERWGDLFAGGCLVLSLGWWLTSAFPARRMAS